MECGNFETWECAFKELWNMLRRQIFGNKVFQELNEYHTLDNMILYSSSFILLSIYEQKDK